MTNPDLKQATPSNAEQKSIVHRPTASDEAAPKRPSSIKVYSDNGWDWKCDTTEVDAYMDRIEAKLASRTESMMLWAQIAGRAIAEKDALERQLATLKASIGTEPAK